MKRLTYLVALVPIALSACALQFSNSGTSAPAKADGGVYFSLDTGSSWAQRVFVRQDVKGPVTIASTNVGFFLFDPTNSTDLYVSTLENGVWKSTDTAETWTQTGLKQGYVQGLDIDAHDSQTLFAGVGNTVQKSTDGGTTWATVYTNQPGNTITQVRVNPFDSLTIFATTNGGVVLKSTDAGTTWKIIHQFQGDYVTRLTMFRADPRTMYAVTPKTLYRTIDAGLNWTDSMGQGLAKVGGLPVNDFTYTDHTPNVMYVAANAGLFRSSDAGSTWKAVPTVIPPSTVPILTIAVNPFQEQELLFTANATFYKSVDSGVTWQTLKNVGSARTFRVLVAHPRRPGLLFLGTFLVKKK